MTLWPVLAVLIVAAAALTRFGMRFHRKQNSGALGGKISRAKAYWLPFAIFFWFVLCPLVAVTDVFAPPVCIALGAFGVFMWLRGAAEMVMLYVTKNWRPPMGITHDALCIVLLLGTLLFFLTSRGGVSSLRAVDGWGLFLIGSAVVSLIVEIHHAHSFFVAVQGRTTGEEGVWFADDEDERFRRINRNTLIWNVILSLALGVFVIRFLIALV